MKVFIKILKIIAGIALGLLFSFLTIVGLDAILPTDNPFGKNSFNLWYIAPIIAGWLFFFLWLLLRKPSSKKIQTNGIELLPQSISELIDGIIDAMKYRRSVRAEVRQELTDHFTDALADYQTEEEKQKATKELIEEFGDIELLGKLLRRAKKRCRPLWRTMVVRFFQLIGICFVLLILYIGWFFTGKPQVTTNYLEIMNQKVRPVADKNQNAWPYYKQAAEKYVKHEDKNFDFYPIKSSPFMRSDEDKIIIRQMINDNQQSLDLIRQGNQKPYYWVVHDIDESGNPELISILMPHLGSYRDLARLMCWQGLFSTEEGSFEKTFNNLLETHSFGHHLRGKNLVLIEFLVATSIETMATDTLKMILSKYDEQIDIQLLDSNRSWFANTIENTKFAIDFEGEKLFMYDEAQRCFTQSRFGKSHLYLPRLNNNLYGFDDYEKMAIFFGQQPIKILFTHPDKQETLREVERLYSEMEKLSILTPASVNAQGLNMEVVSEEIVRKNIFIGILMPALTKVNEIAWRVRIQTEATLVILALMQYEKQNGQYPELLDALVKEGLLKEVPIDPFSDKPLLYRKANDDFILYSVGSNFIDDNAAPSSDDKGKPKQWGNNGDWIFWPVTGN